MQSYVTDDKDIEQLTRSLLSATATGDTARGTYFRSLIAMTQLKLGLDKPRAVSVKRYGKLSDDARQTQISMLKEVHSHSYGIVLDVIGNDTERNRKSTFARTAYATLTAWVRVGGSLLDLNLNDVSKHKVRVMTEKRRIRTAPTGHSDMERVVTSLVRVAKETAGESPKEAAAQLQAAMDAIGAAMLDLGLTKIARSAETAGKQDRPFKVGDVMMWPVHSMPAQLSS